MELEKGKRYWRWQIPEEERKKMPKKHGLKQLINNLILIGMLLSLVFFLFIPLAMYPDIMWWLNSGNLISLSVSLIILFVVYSINTGKYEFRPPVEVEDLVKKPKRTLPATRTAPRQEAPKTIKLGVCDICEREVPLTELSGFEFEENGKSVTINICNKCYKEAGYE